MFIVFISNFLCLKIVDNDLEKDKQENHHKVDYSNCNQNSIAKRMVKARKKLISLVGAENKNGDGARKVGGSVSKVK